MPDAITEIHLVDNLDQAYNVARDLGAKGIGLDVENVLTPFYGDHPDLQALPWIDKTNLDLVQRQLIESPEVRQGLMTNNTNSSLSGSGKGIVDVVSDFLIQQDGQRVSYVHKGLLLPDGTELRSKRSGDQGKALAEILGIPVPDMVLFDDQGIKNTGEAVRAGFRAIIVPNSIGERNSKGRVIEHPGVMRLRKFEPAIYRSLAKRGNLAMGAFKMIAGIDLSQIADLVDHRTYSFYR